MNERELLDILPQIGGAAELGPVFTDERGTISNILFKETQSIARIWSKRGAIRANHIHRTDWHYTLLESGTVLYFEREIGSKVIPEPTAFGPGTMFFTPPVREHAMLFAQDSVIYTFARNVRSHDNHEADLERVDFITPGLAADFLARWVP